METLQPDVGNIVITGVTTSADNPDYFKFDPLSTDSDLNQPSITFTINDSGNANQYAWKVRVRNTEREDWDDSILVQGHAGTPDNITVELNNPDAFGYSQDSELNTWGTYTFEISVDEVDATGNALGDNVNYRSQNLFLPTWVGANQDNPGHEFILEEDENGVEKGLIKYYLRDDTNTDATAMKVELLPPSLTDSIDTFTAANDGLNVGEFHPGENEPDILLHTFDEEDEEGLFTAVFTGTDGHAEEYRDHVEKRALAKNDKGSRGKYKVEYVRFMTSDYSEEFGIRQSGLPLKFGGIYSVPEVLYIEARIQLKSGVTAPNNILVSLRASGTAKGQSIKVPLAKHNTPQAGWRPTYRGIARIWESDTHVLNQSNNAIGIPKGEDSALERTWIDNNDPSDSNNIVWGKQRGKGWVSDNAKSGWVTGNIDFARAAGVEFIQASKDDRWSKVPVKNEADLIYFSGHGSSATGRISTGWPGYQPEEGTLPMTSVTTQQATRWGASSEWNGHSLAVTATPLSPANWSDVDCLIIAGCSVLNLPSITEIESELIERINNTNYTEKSRFDADNTDENGRIWADASLTGRTGGGKLDALCGYYEGGPADNTGVPQEISKGFTKEITGYTRRGGVLTGQHWVNSWMAAHQPPYNDKDKGTFARACAMTSTQYRYLEPTPDNNPWKIETSSY